MLRPIRWPLAATALFFVAAAWGQNVDFNDRPRLYKPKMPPTARELQQRESLYQYVDGLLFERADKFRDALNAFEKSARLDPDSPAPIKAQVPILLAMRRFDDALAGCKKVVALDPEDFGSWYVQAKIQKAMVQYAEAIVSLQSALKSTALKEHPEAAQALHFELGSLYESTGKFGPAADAYNKAAAILEHPDLIEERARVPHEAVLMRASETYEKIGLLYRKAKQYDRAIAAFKKAAERAPEHAGPFYYGMAQVAQEAGDSAQALAHLDEYLRGAPLSVEPYEMKADLLRRTKQADKIVPWLEELTQRDKFNTALQGLLAREYAGAGQSQKAEALFTKLIDDSPSAELYRGLFRLYQAEGPTGMARVLAMLDKLMHKGDGPPSIRTINQGKAMVGAFRDDAELARGLVAAASRNQRDLQPDTTLFVAVLADKHRKLEEAERFYRQCLTDAKTVEGNEAILYTGLLRVLSRGRKYEAIVQLCGQGLKLAKTTSPLLFYNELARAQANLHEYDAALKTVDLALKQPGNGELVFRILRIRVLTMAERYTDAEADCKALLKDNNRPGEIVELRYLLSNVYAAAKRPADAEEQLQLILKLEPDNPTVNNDLGYSWADQNKNLEAAEAMIRKAIDGDRDQRRKSANLSPEDDKDNAAYVDSLGWVLYRRGKVEEARKELERAIALNDGDDPVIYEHLGDVYQHLRMATEASRAWQRSLELYEQGIRGKDEPRMRDIRRKIEQVKQVGGDSTR